MRKRVVEGGPILFEEDLPIEVAAIGRPLALPPPSILPDRFTIWYKGRFFELDRSPAYSYARIWSRRYGLREVEPALAREARYVRQPQVAAAQRQWLAQVLPGADFSGSSRAPGAQVLRVVREKIDELCVVPLRSPQPSVGKGTVVRCEDQSVLVGMHGYGRILHVDGKIYELLSLAEYLGRFARAIDPGFLEVLQQECDRRTPREICERMRRQLDQLDKETYGVIKGKVHHDERTFELYLDGVYFIPEYLCAATDWLSIFLALLDKTLKIDALTQAESLFTTR